MVFRVWTYPSFHCLNLLVFFPTQLEFLLFISVNNDHYLKPEHLGNISSSEFYLFITFIFPNSSTVIWEIRLFSHNYQIRVEN